MASLRKRMSWTLIILLLGVLGVWKTWAFLFPHPLLRGRVAYARGDWRQASLEARRRLDRVPSDPEALRLLARASGRLQEDQTAQALYARLGAKYLHAEDYYLIASSLIRQHEVNQPLVLLRQARAEDPQNPEVLFELARLLAKADQLLEATPIARQLAQTPGWESRGSFVLALLLRAQNDTTGATSAFHETLARDPTLEGLSSPPNELAKLLARTLLESGQPSEAERVLVKLSGNSSDAEASWLLARTWLQQEDREKARKGMEQSRPYSADHVMEPEPAQFVGSTACAECHPANYRPQVRSRHAKTFHRAEQLAKLAVPEQPVKDPEQAEVVHTFSHQGHELQLSTHVGNEVLHAVADYAFGSGDRGLTLVGHERSGQARELRLSRYERGAIWDRTSGQIPIPDDRHEFLGRPLTPDGVRRCIICHQTTAVNEKTADHPETMDHAIGCERCHGPGGNHLKAIKLELPDLAIMRPRLATSSQIVLLCGQCHSPRGSDVDPAEPTSVRFQATTLTWSRCYSQSAGALSCVTCHSPHHDAATDIAAYEAKCLSCHSKTPNESSEHLLVGTRPIQLPEDVERKPCPVNSQSGCVECHMPKVVGPIPHSPFTDHHIRAHTKAGSAE